MVMDHDQAVQLVRRLMAAIYQAVATSGDRGAQRGVVFAALTVDGCDMATYERFEDSLVEHGALRRHGQLLFAVPDKARELGLAA